MRVLAVNAGSSSLKLSVVGEDDTVVTEAESGTDVPRVDALAAFITRAGQVDAVAHRFVHGGASLRQPTVVDGAVRDALEAAIPLAPLHVPAALELLDAGRRLLDCPHVVCLDTAFHATLPERATTYAVPQSWRDAGVRRYGFHGLSYAWASRRAAELLGRPLTELQMLLAHIGSGVSVCAVRGGRSVDTSMGFTPAEGAVMATRSGSVDPGALLWAQQNLGIDAASMTTALETESGLHALCGLADVRDVEGAAVRGDVRAAHALDVYVHALCRNLGAVAASLRRLDALVFTGGVGEHSPVVRSRICAGLALIGVTPVPELADGDTVLAAPADRTAVVVVAAREDAEMAREARQVLRRSR